MASHVEHEIEEIQPNTQGTGRGKGKKWSDSETDRLIDVLEKHFCLWDVSKKVYLLRNLRERAYEEMRHELDIEIADIKTKNKSPFPAKTRDCQNKVKEVRTGCR